MKKIAFLALAAITFASCNNNTEPKAETTEKQAAAATDGTAYTVDSTSKVGWVGSKPTGTHSGTFKVKEGALTVKDGALTAGSFIIDVASLNNEDLAADAESKAKLEGHLKSPDFFDVAKYPTAKFEITGVEVNTDTTKVGITHIIKGNLTLKDSTKNVAVPAKVTVDAKTLAATASFSIDRTLWGINYKGPNNPQDWVISKEVAIKLNITATAK
ncbi:YceI family protein [Ferruginibacter yonginensis]|uniref:YceI family protein n=1 Tax=Ferruginibacter yonginensis TaxID=1310416 RepID=A0ABV8QST4_9BACT